MNPAPPVTTIVLTRRAYLRRAKDRSSFGHPDDAGRPRVGGVRLLDTRTQPSPELRTLFGREPGEPLEPVGELLRGVARETQLFVEEVREARIRGEHRQAGRAGLVHDLVGRAGA